METNGTFEGCPKILEMRVTSATKKQTSGDKNNFTST